MQVSIITDEVSQDFREALAFSADHQIRNVAIRSAEGKNVLDFDDIDVRFVQTTLDSHGVTLVSCLSPLFKCHEPSQSGGPALDDPNFVSTGKTFDEMTSRRTRLWEIAGCLGVRYVRVFPFLRRAATAPPEDESVAWLERLQTEAAHRGLLAAVENEHTCVGGTFEGLLDLASRVKDPMPLVLDPCNHWHVTGDDGLEALERHPELVDRAVDIHVKDVDTEGNHVAAGDGVVRWDEIFELLHRQGYQGLITLEPHLPGNQVLVERSIEAVRSWIR